MSKPFLIYSINCNLYHYLSLSFFAKIKLNDIPKDTPKHIPIPIPAILSNIFTKTRLQIIAIAIPIISPIIIFLFFISYPPFKLLFSDYI